MGMGEMNVRQTLTPRDEIAKKISPMYPNNGAGVDAAREFIAKMRDAPIEEKKTLECCVNAVAFSAVKDFMGKDEKLRERARLFLRDVRKNGTQEEKDAVLDCLTHLVSFRVEGDGLVRDSFVQVPTRDGLASVRREGGVEVSVDDVERAGGLLFSMADPRAIALLNGAAKELKKNPKFRDAARRFEEMVVRLEGAHPNAGKPISVALPEYMDPNSLKPEEPRFRDPNAVKPHKKKGE